MDCLRLSKSEASTAPPIVKLERPLPLLLDCRGAIQYSFNPRQEQSQEKAFLGLLGSFKPSGRTGCTRCARECQCAILRPGTARAGLSGIPRAVLVPVSIPLQACPYNETNCEVALGSHSAGQLAPQLICRSLVCTRGFFSIVRTHAHDSQEQWYGLQIRAACGSAAPERAVDKSGGSFRIPCRYTSSTTLKNWQMSESQMLVFVSMCDRSINRISPRSRT